MKNFKKLFILMLTLASTTSNIIPHGGGWGGFGGGLATGVILTSAVNSGNRRGNPDPAYYDYKDRNAQRVEINKEIRKLRNEINQHKRELRKLDSNKNLDEKTRQSRRAEHTAAIADLEQTIKDLREDLRTLY